MHVWEGLTDLDPVGEEMSFIRLVPQVLIQVSVGDFLERFQVIDRDEVAVQVHELDAHLIVVLQKEKKLQEKKKKTPNNSEKRSRQQQSTGATLHTPGLSRAAVYIVHIVVNPTSKTNSSFFFYSFGLVSLHTWVYVPYFCDDKRVQCRDVETVCLPRYTQLTRCPYWLDIKVPSLSGATDLYLNWLGTKVPYLGPSTVL